MSLRTKKSRILHVSTKPLLRRAAAPAEITDDDVHVFTEGSCHVLAHEVHKLTGWPIHCFVGDDKKLEQHAFIVPRPGWRLDVEGLSPADQHDKRWGWSLRVPKTNHQTFSWKQISAKWGAWECHAERAAEIAPLIVALVNDSTKRHSAKKATVCATSGGACRK